MTLGARAGPKRGPALRRSDMSWMTLEDEADLPEPVNENETVGL